MDIVYYPAVMGSFPDAFSPRQYSGRQPANRLMSKDGATAVKTVGVSGRQRQYMYDFFTTMVDIRWRWNILLFVISFLSAWLLFAAYYYLICTLHGDFDEKPKDGNWTPCVKNVKSFVSAYLFSIETQSTIGYGFRYITEDCPAAFFGVLLQSVIGAGLQAALAGLVIAKVRRAKKRGETIMFSSVACVVEEDWKLKLVFRIGDMRKSTIIGAHARGILIKKASKDGKNLPIQHFQLDFKAADGGSHIFLSWPNQVAHVIDEKSPLWNVSRDDLLHENFELIVIFEGIVFSTGKAVQIKTSYLPNEIMWGHRFFTVGRNTDKKGKHIVDFSNFNATFQVPTPSCSSKELTQMIRSGDISLEKLQSSSPRRTKSHKIPVKRYSIMDTYLGFEDNFDDDS